MRVESDRSGRGSFWGREAAKGKELKKNKKCMHSHGVPNKKERSSYQKKSSSQIQLSQKDGKEVKI